MASDKHFVSILSVKAEKEILSTWEWYEDRQQGLGDKFLEEFLLKIKVIEHQPDLFSSKYKHYREATLSKFPIIIVYLINKKKNFVRIISVFHSSRHPRTKFK